MDKLLTTKPPKTFQDNIRTYRCPLLQWGSSSRAYVSLAFPQQQQNVACPLNLPYLQSKKLYLQNYKYIISHFIQSFFGFFGFFSKSTQWMYLVITVIEYQE